jgi:uncharacterized hydrophobic protein (TIGR00271 family)
MLHVRVVSPPSLTGRLTHALTGDPGVVNLVVVPAAASCPDGDAVQFDLMSQSANQVLQLLVGLGLDRTSSVMIEQVDATIADPAEHQGWRPSWHGERAPVWRLVEARIQSGAEYAPSFFALLVLAGLIGACGILTNSQVLIVGAMVVGPEYYAISAVALGLDRREGAAVRTGLLALLAGFSLAIAVTLLFALCIRWSGRTPPAFLHGVRPVADLINSPNLFSVVVAVVAAVVGVVSLTLERTGALIGVFISVTTIPAAAAVAVSVAYGDWQKALGSVEQLLLNVGLLIIVGALAMRGQRRLWRRLTRAAPRPLRREQSPVATARAEKLLVAAALDSPAAVEHDDLVQVGQGLHVMRDEQRGPVLGDRQHVGHESPGGIRVEARGRLVQYQHRRVSQQRAGERDPLPLTARDARPPRAHAGVQTIGQRPDPRQQPGARGGVEQLVVGRARPGEPEIGANRVVEHVRVLRAAAYQPAQVVGCVAGQVVAAQLGGTASQIAEPQQHVRGCRLARAAAPDKGDSPARRQVEVQPVQGERCTGLIPHARTAQRHGRRA